MSELSIGFVGLGNMGWPMAANLHAAGFPLVVRDADAARQSDWPPTWPRTASGWWTRRCPAACPAPSPASFH